MNEEKKMPASVRYNATLSELTEMGVRSAELSGMARRNYMGGFWAVLALGLFVGLVLPEPLKVRITFGILTGIIGATIHATTFRTRIRKAIRIHNEKLYSSPASLSFEYVLRDSGIIFRTAGSELAVNWDTVTSHRVMPEYLEIVTDKFLVAQIPTRAFVPTEALKAWATAIEAKTSGLSKKSGS